MLKGISFPSSVESVSSGAFIGCSSLSVVRFQRGNGNKLKSLESGVFSDCVSLLTVDIANCDNLKEINDECFKGCSKLRSMKLPNNVLQIQSRVFFGCESLIEVEFGKNLKSLGASCFEGCTKLTKMVLPSHLEKIGERCFSKCGLKGTLVMPSSITSVGASSLSETSLRRISYCGSNELLERAVADGQAPEMLVLVSYPFDTALGIPVTRILKPDCVVMIFVNEVGTFQNIFINVALGNMINE